MQPHVAHVRAAGATAQVLAQAKCQIHRHRDMPVFRAGHGEYLAVDVFVAFGLRGLPGQVVGGRINGGLWGASRGPILVGMEVPIMEATRGTCQSGIQKCKVIIIGLVMRRSRP